MEVLRSIWGWTRGATGCKRSWYGCGTLPRRAFSSAVLRLFLDLVEAMPSDVITINRAPVLTLWATIFAERLGVDHDEALTLGRAVAGLSAYSKVKALGIFKPSPKDVKAERANKTRVAARFDVALPHRAVPVQRMEGGLRAVSMGKPIDPASVAKYLRSKFGPSLAPATTALIALADSFDPDDLARDAYSLYEKFRPEIPAGEAGWGAGGELSTTKNRALSGR